MIARQVLPGVTVTDRLAASIGFHSVPLLLGNVYWFSLCPSLRPVPDGMNCRTRRVGENAPPIGPAPAEIVDPEAGRCVFHCSFSDEVVLAVLRIVVWTKADFGLKVPAKPPLSFQASG